jgi:recombinational DNA repair protein RecT
MGRKQTLDTTSSQSVATASFAAALLALEIARGPERTCDLRRLREM